MVTDCHNVLVTWRNNFSQLLDVHGVNDIRQTEIHPADQLVPEPCPFEVEMANEKIKGHRSPYINPIQAKRI